MKISDVRVDAAKIEAGDWIGGDDLESVFPMLAGVRLKVRGMGNADYRRLQGKLMRSIAAKRLSRDKEEEATLQMTNELVVKTILLDWSGIEDGDPPVAIPYSEERAAAYLADPEMRIFRDAVMHAAGVVATRKKEVGETTEKN